MTPTSGGAKSLNGRAATAALSETELLARITAPLQAALPLDEVLRQILRGVTDGLDVERADLYLLDERARTLVGSQAVLHHEEPGGAGSEGIAGLRIPLTRGAEVLSATVRDARAHVIEDLQRPAGNLTLESEVRQRVQAGAFAAVPLVAWGQVVGVLTLNDSRRRRSFAERLPLLNAFAFQAGLAIERARLFEDRERAIRELNHLQQATAALQQSLPLDRILQRILEGVTEGLEAGRAMLYLFDAERRVLTGAHAALIESSSAGAAELTSTIRELEIPVGDPEEVLSATVLSRRAFAVVEGTPQEGPVRLSPVLPARLGIKSFVTAPLLAQDRVVGVLMADELREGVPREERVQMLVAYGAHAGLAVERTLLEEKLRASERRYRQFIERSPDGIVESSTDGRLISCNDGILELLGYTREEILRLNAREIWVDPSAREAMMRELGSKGKVEGLEVAVRRKDGRICYVNVSSRLRQGAEGPVLESIIRDITERYEVERRMRMLAHAVTHSADAIVSLDAAAHITSWNLGAEKIFGYTAEEMIGRPYQDLVPPDRIDELCSVIKERVEEDGHLLDFETERVRKDGQRIPVSVTVTRLRHNGGPDLGWTAVVRDISGRRREEQRRQLLSSITEQSPDAILSVDRGGRITSWNRGAEKMFGYASSEIVGRPFADLAPAERAGDFARVTSGESGDNPGGEFVLDTLALARGGRHLPVRLSSSVLRARFGSEEIGWVVILRDLTEQMTLAEKTERLQDELTSRHRLEGIVGDSRAMEDVRERIRRVARFSSSVLLVGSSGTGKEIVANAIHYNSHRRERPFIKVNCAAIPEHLLESELFGIERNVATGVDGRIGRFEMADGGTLFLDEIGDMSLPTQAKILRVLQEREFERVGGKQNIKVDVRIIAATNKDLDEEIRARRFRDDLYYRLNVIVITLPPLADRREDIDPLIDHFLEKFTRENGLPRRKLSLSARRLLNAYDWPGNVRELEHCIERAVVMSEGPEIEDLDLPPSLQIWKELSVGGQEPGAPERSSLADTLRQVERRTVLEALERSGWVQAKAARLLGISERSMWYRVKKLRLRPSTK